ncbi:MAG TPA: ATP-binding protein [Mycobacteriales bacterium]|jgi:hypothetical protein
MLRSFRFANHRSFRDEHELLLLPAYDKSRQVVPVTALYGANASGKSTVVDALRFLRQAVTDSYPRWEPDEGVPRTPFRFDPGCRNDSSIYVVDIVADGVRHVYGFVVDDVRVREEWLYAYPHGRKRTLFERDGDTLDFGASRARTESAVRELIRPNALFLSLASRLRLPPVLPMYEWVRHSLRIAGRYLPSGLAARLQANPDQAERVRSLLSVADLGISDIQIETVDEPTPRGLRLILARQRDAAGEELAAATARFHAASTPEERSKHESELAALRARVSLLEARVEGNETRPRSELFFVHGTSVDSPLGFAEESRGTQRWLELLVPALEVLDTGSVFVVDEIDSSLHPLLVAQLVRLFRSEESNPNGAQLLFTAHDTSLMGTALGEDVLARDQIWFVEKDSDGASKIFPLTDFHPRKGENPERRYLGGSYGAVPVLGEPDLGEATRG